MVRPTNYKNQVRVSSYNLPMAHERHFYMVRPTNYKNQVRVSSYNLPMAHEQVLAHNYKIKEE